MSITTVGACKSFRGIGTENQEHDAELERIISAVQAFLEEECGRVFDAGEVTEYFDGDQWSESLLVARPPINSIVNLWDDPARAYTTAIPLASYEIKDAKAGIIRLLDGIRFSYGRRNIKLTYNGGFQTMPLDLQQAA